jgi:hypothetical protein
MLPYKCQTNTCASLGTSLEVPKELDYEVPLLEDRVDEWLNHKLDHCPLTAHTAQYSLLGYHTSPGPCKLLQCLHKCSVRLAEKITKENTRD